MKIHRLLILFGLFICSLSAAEGQDAPDLKGLKQQLVLEKEEALKPVVELQEKYESALTRLREQTQADGNLEGVLEIGREIEHFRERDSGSHVEPAGNPRLQHLQSVYENELVLRLEKVKSLNETALRRHAFELEKMTERLTKLGELEKAIQSSEELERVRSEINSSPEEMNPPSSLHDEEGTIVVLAGREENYTTSGVLPLEVELIDSTHRLWSEGNATKVLSKEPLRTPFRLVARAETDSNEIRVYFGEAGSVWFNRQAEDFKLRVVDPITRENHTLDPEGCGELTPEQMHDLEVRVTENEIAVFIDGREKGKIAGSFAAVEGLIGLGPSIGSTVTVEYFKGIQGDVENPN